MLYIVLIFTVAVCFCLCDTMTNIPAMRFIAALQRMSLMHALPAAANVRGYALIQTHISCPALSLLLHRCRTCFLTVWLMHDDVQVCVYASSLCISSQHSCKLRASQTAEGCISLHKLPNSTDAFAAQAQCWHTQYPTKKPHTPHLWFPMNQSQIHSLFHCFPSGIPRSATEDGGLCTRTGAQCGLCGSSDCGVPVRPGE